MLDSLKKPSRQWVFREANHLPDELLLQLLDLDVVRPHYALVRTGI